MKRLAVLESSTGIGGAEINVFRLAPVLRAAGWDLVVLVPGTGDLTAALTQRGIRWCVYDAPAFSSTSRYLHGTKVPDPFANAHNLWALVSSVQQVNAVLVREQVSVLHTNSIFSHLIGAAVARRAKVPCVWHLQDIVAVDSGLGLFRRALRAAARSTTFIVCISKAVARQLEDAGLEKRIRVVYNGIDTGHFIPEGGTPHRSAWTGENYAMVVGQVGRLTPWKGQEMLIALARSAQAEQLPIRFVIVGQDSFGLPGYRARLQKLVQTHGLGDRVLFVDWQSDMPGVYRSLDLLVHPTVEPEPFGLVLAEAMACGMPIVYFDHGGAGEVVGAPEAGIAVKPGDIPSLWQAVKWVYTNRDQAVGMGQRARARAVSRFDLNRFAAEMLDVYETALDGAA
jgi:glycosyltransferase involved in cell wall biosynthesis